MTKDKNAPVRNVLLTLMTIGTGSVDATTFLSVGHVFSSVITGNLVLLGISAAGQEPRLALSAGVALGAYAAGVAAGARPRTARRSPDGLWPLAVTVTLAGELVVLCGFSAGWELVHARRGGWQVVLIGLLAAAMGLQSAAVRRLGTVSTTYLTSTLTSLVAGLVGGEGRDGSLRSLVLVIAMAAGAAAGTVTLHLAPRLTPVAVAGPLAVVVLAATFLSRLGRRATNRAATRNREDGPGV